MMYNLDFTERAKKDIKSLKRSEPQVYKKLEKLLVELMEHPCIGTGQIEQLKGNRCGQWSRRISGKHRLVYEVYEEKITVIVLSAHGHYTDL